MKRVLKRIRQTYPNIDITVRADSGFSGPEFYKLADEYRLKYAIGQASNSVLKQKVVRVEKAIKHLFVNQGVKHQHFFKHEYQAGSWHKPQICYTKVESTGKGLNVRHIISNIPCENPRDVYFDFYVKRGDSSENRIKEVKNMCFSDRLSNHGFWANFMRLFLSSMAYELFLLIKKAVGETKHEKAKKWQIDTIRVSLLKVGATLKETKRRVYYKFSKAFAQQELLSELLLI